MTEILDDASKDDLKDLVKIEGDYCQIADNSSTIFNRSERVAAMDFGSVYRPADGHVLVSAPSQIGAFVHFPPRDDLEEERADPSKSERIDPGRACEC